MSRPSRREILADFPRWHSSPNDLDNLREVSPGLFVGSAYAPRRRVEWDTILDFCGTSRNPSSLNFCIPEVAHGYRRARVLKVLPFVDGQPFPKGALDVTWEAVKASRGVVLLHCARGLSRSASAAYAVLRRGFGLSHEEAHYTIRVTSAYPVEETLRSARAWVAETRGRPW